MATSELKPVIATPQVDDARVRITEYRFPPGSHTGWHRHEMNYAVVPIKGGPLRMVSAEGETVNTLVSGKAYSRPAGVEHDVINDGPGEVVFVEIEIKSPAA